MFKVNNRNTRTSCEICSKFTPCFTVSIVNFEQVNAEWVQTPSLMKERNANHTFTLGCEIDLFAIPRKRFINIYKLLLKDYHR